MELTEGQTDSQGHCPLFKKNAALGLNKKKFIVFGNSQFTIPWTTSSPAYPGSKTLEATTAT